MVVHFITEVITQYSTMPKILRTDNALELVQDCLTYFVLIMTFFIRLCVHIYPSKMVLPNKNIVNFLTLLVYYSLR